MYIDQQTGRSIYGVWNEQKGSWELDLQGLVTIKTLAAAARERMEKNPESMEITLVPNEDLSPEELAEFEAELNADQANELDYEIELAIMEIKARARERVQAQQVSA